MKQYLNTSEIAKLLKVNRATVTRWAKQGKFKGAIRIDKSHQWRIPLSAFEELVQTKNESCNIFHIQRRNCETTSTVNTAAALVNKGKKVLVVDLDQQASATRYLDLDPDVSPNLYEVFM